MSQPVLLLAVATAAVVALAVLAGVSLHLAAAIARARLRRANPAPGRLVPAAGTTLHAVRTGPDRGPTVVLVAGVGGLGAGWAGIQERLGPSVATLAYDRAGLGWSGPARGPRTAEALADELHELLVASGAPTPSWWWATRSAGSWPATSPTGARGRSPASCSSTPPRRSSTRGCPRSPVSSAG